MTYALHLIKAGLKTYYDVDPQLVDIMLLNGRLRVRAISRSAAVLAQHIGRNRKPGIAAA